MTRDQAQKLLPIIQAFAEGKEIQYNGFNGWVNCEFFHNWEHPEKYRIKPEKKTGWIAIFANGYISLAYETRNKAAALGGYDKDNPIVAIIPISYEEGEGL